MRKVAKSVDSHAMVRARGVPPPDGPTRQDTELHVPARAANAHPSDGPARSENHPIQTPQCFEQLTPRELQIAMLICYGRLNKQIAQQLRISEYTVSAHLRRIFAKLRVHNRAAMVFVCSSSGMRPEPH